MRPGDGRDQVQVMDGDARGDPAGLLWFLRIMTDLPKVGMLGAGACEGRRDHGRREGGRVTVHTSAPLVGGVLDESLPADVRADARHDGRSCRCVPVRDVCGPCRRLIACRPDAAGKDNDDGRPSRRAGPGRIRQRGRDGLSAGSAHHGRPAHDGDGRAGRMQDMTTCPEDDPVTDGAVLGDRRRKKAGTGHGDLLAGLVPPAGRWTQGRRSA